MSRHLTRALVDPFTGRTVDIDIEMVPVIEQLWRLGIETTSCCQGWPGTDLPAVICFREPISEHGRWMYGRSRFAPANRPVDFERNHLYLMALRQFLDDLDLFDEMMEDVEVDHADLYEPGRLLWHDPDTGAARVLQVLDEVAPEYLCRWRWRWEMYDEVNEGSSLCLPNEDLARLARWLAVAPGDREPAGAGTTKEEQWKTRPTATG
jgi:hypothetical protein